MVPPIRPPYQVKPMPPRWCMLTSGSCSSRKYTFAPTKPQIVAHIASACAESRGRPSRVKAFPSRYAPSSAAAILLTP